MTRFVLVHGAFLGPWCFDALADGLRRAGHRVDVPAMPGSGAGVDVLAGVTFEQYTEVVCAELRTGGPAVLVGHSLGGMTITAAAGLEPELIQQLVYLAAFVPADGESVADLVARPEARGEGLRSVMSVTGNPPVGCLTAEDARRVLYPRASDDVAARTSRRLGLHPTWVPNTAVHVPRGGPPRAYVVCTDDRAIPPALQTAMATAAHCRPIRFLDADHCPFLSEPYHVQVLLTDLTGLAGSADDPTPALFHARAGEPYRLG